MDYQEFRKDPRGTVSDWLNDTLSRACKENGIQVIDDVANEIGKSDNSLKQYAYKTSYDQNIRVFELPAVLEKTGEFLILQELCALFGYVVLPVNGNLLETLKALVKALEATP